MDIAQIPFHQKLGLKPSSKTDYLLHLPFDNSNTNHLSTLHASAIFALAEVSTGEYLQIVFKDIVDQVLPVMRAAKVKYRKPVESDLYSKAKLVNIEPNAFLEELQTKKKASITVECKLYNDADEMVFSGEYEWFVGMRL
jgi:thioesterase domain-containing protein